MAMIINNITYKYNPNTAFEVTALEDISLKISDGEFIAIIGHTGSGKSTLIQQMNGLLKPASGEIYYNGENIADKEFDISGLRTQVGMVFQYPEHQLFETSVFEDVKFGPKNQGLTDKEATLRAYEALEMVHFPEELFDQAPFDISGGQRRLAAIAGILAMKPLMLILDEPTAGLDPQGKKEILNLISELHRDHHKTIVLVSHSMEDVAEYADRIIVINEGRIAYDDSPKNVFKNFEHLERMGLKAPQTVYLMKALEQEGMLVETDAVTVEAATQAILKAIAGN